MQRFTALYLDLDSTTKTSRKVAVLREYFSSAPPADAAWALAFLTGQRFKRIVTTTALRDWISEMSALPAWLVNESYDLVGDLAETLALLLPESGDGTDLPLHRVVEDRIAPLAQVDEQQRKRIVTETWREFSPAQRLVWNKLILGSFRVGVAKKLVTNALALAADIEPAVMAHRLMAGIEPTADAFRTILSGDIRYDDTARPYPFFLAHPIQNDDITSIGDVGDWFVEWKYDGIRAQIIRRGVKTILWSRGEAVINEQFPEIVEQAARLPDGTVLDGEVLAWENDRPLSFNLLQRRLGRKDVEPVLFADVPVAFMTFDLLEWRGADCRERAMEERRRLLQRLGFGESRTLILSPLLPVRTWDDCRSLLARARDEGTEGLMLKRKSSPYRAGRPRGDWWKWKVNPFTVDAVLIYAQLGSGKRAGLFTDYTFGVWNATTDSATGDEGEGEGELTPVAKAYSGLTDEEIREVDRHIRRTTIGRHGPVRVVQPELVFELAFEGIQSSSRHKAGLALRFPRMARWRRDKRPEDADTLETLRMLLAASEQRRSSDGET